MSANRSAPRFTPPEIAPLTWSIESELRARIDRKTKPLGSLGAIEEIALRLGLVQGTVTPSLARPTIVVFAADHGVVAEGVSAYPQEVTGQMVANFLSGGAGINVFARHAGLALVVVDAGVRHPVGSQDGVLPRRIAPGTANLAREPAMSREQACRALDEGAAVVRRIAAEGTNVVGFGEMGIGNTASASLLMSLMTDIPITECVGPGTGLDAAGVARKAAVLGQARDRVLRALGDVRGAARELTERPLEVLVEAGGFEIAMICGAMMEAAARRMVILVDGFIATSALLCARSFAPEVVSYGLFCHCSGEPGHRLMLEHLDARPLLDLGLRLGEGTGAALAYPLVAAAAAFLAEMATFDSAGVSERDQEPVGEAPPDSGPAGEDGAPVDSARSPRIPDCG